MEENMLIKDLVGPDCKYENLKYFLRSFYDDTKKEIWKMLRN